MKLGAEYVPFCLVSSGPRVDTIIGRASNPRHRRRGHGDGPRSRWQYEGYIASFNFPFVVGTMSDSQRQLISWLIGAYEAAISELRAGNPQCNLVGKVRGYFRDNALAEYGPVPPAARLRAWPRRRAPTPTRRRASRS